MIYPASRDLEALRWQPFRFEIDFEGIDFTGANAWMQVRQFRDQPGSPLIDLGLAELPAQGLKFSGTIVDGVPLSTLRIIIGEDTIEQLPFSSEIGNDVDLRYDIVIEGGGFIKSRWLEGKFIVRGGSTQV